jgi:N-acetyl-anhydromuramyl-L-alanine amidase AmpD
MVVVNWTHKISAEKYRERPIELATTQVIHRNSAYETVKELVPFFHGYKGTGYKFPYHFVIHKDGQVFQVVPLTKVAPGAIKLNKCGVQICLIGDFRKHPPTPAQAKSLIDLSTYLYSIGAKTITGHTSVAGSSDDPDKICPGEHLVVAGILPSVREQLTYKASEEAVYAGIII